MKLKSLNVFFAVLLSIALVSCGTPTKTAGTGDEPVAAVESESIDLSSIDLNADSDSGKAGPIKTVFFDFNSANLRSDTRRTLAENAGFLKANSSVEIQVEGHCDERGGVQYNLALGEKRARAVKRYLVNMGISSSRISTISFGKERPLAFGHDEDAWSQNRRGNFVITAK